MFKNKKAFGDVVSTLIMFIAVVGVSTGFVIAIKNYALNTQSSINYQNEIVNNQLKTSIEITNMVYNSSTTYVYVKNLGQTQLMTSQFDFFLDDVYISDFLIYYADNVSKNMTMLSPAETGVFVKAKALAAGTHKIRLVSGYGGVGDTDYFNN